MGFTTGYNFTPNTFGRASEVNSNFAWMRGHYIPITQSGTWETTNGVYDLGSVTKKWRDGHFSGSICCAHLTASTANFANTITAETLRVNKIRSNTDAHIDVNTISALDLELTGVGPTPLQKNRLYHPGIIKGMARINNAGTSTMATTYDYGVNSISFPLAGMTRITWDNSFGSINNHIITSQEISAARLNTTVWSITGNTVDVEIFDSGGLATSGTLVVLASGEQ